MVKRPFCSTFLRRDSIAVFGFGKLVQCLHSLRRCDRLSCQLPTALEVQMTLDSAEPGQNFQIKPKTICCIGLENPRRV